MIHNTCCQLGGRSDIFGASNVQAMIRSFLGGSSLSRLFLLTLLITLSSTAGAVTRSQFAGPYGIIRILARDFSGATDPDGQNLFAAMNVPQKDSILGMGKTIETEDRGLQIVCANRPQIGHECSIFIHNAEFSSVDTIRKTMSYKITGEKANQYGALFNLDTNGAYLFMTGDSSFKIQISPGSFEVHFEQNAAQAAAIRKDMQRHLDTKTLVIVNVEDTLKLAHVRNFWDSLNYTSDLRKRFLGMSAVLNQLAMNNRGFHFAYLTQSPELVAGKTELEFLRKFGFPLGELKTYTSEPNSTKRLQVLKDLIATHSATRVILMSHNGGDDPALFHELAASYTDVLFLPYIHVVYSTSSFSEVGSVLYPEQTGFVTSVELLVDWQQRGFVDFTKSVEISQALIPKILDENIEAPGVYEYAVPSFMNCDDFQWRWSLEGNYQYLTPLRDFLKVRCHMQAPLNKNKTN
jgi:hypothetical protein